MCCQTQNITLPRGFGKKQSAIRLIALVFCVCFIAASFLSTAFIVTQANHEHDHNGPGGSCATCAYVMVAENLLKQISIAVASTAFAIACLFAVLSVFRPFSFQIGFYALVQLKVRLNN